VRTRSKSLGQERRPFDYARRAVEVTATAFLAAHAARPAFIQNFVSPVGDYSDIVQMAPGTFSVGANGPGLGDTKIFFRGFKNGFYKLTFDGLPWNDTNDPTYRSRAFFPGKFIGSTLFDRFEPTLIPAPPAAPPSGPTCS
jgi:TonB-dependent receptor-like protein